MPHGIASPTSLRAGWSSGGQHESIQATPGLRRLLASADRAVESRNLNPVLELLTADVQHAVHRAFTEMVAKKDAAVASDVGAGRAFVGAYVTFIHLVGAIDLAARGASGGHARPSPSTHAPEK